jgi:L-threonylcarbamoyladenylate synthase
MSSPPQVLRAGGIDRDEIVRLLERPLGEPSGPSRTSGMLTAHYEPDCDVLLADSRADAHRVANAQRRAGRRVGILDRTDDDVVAAQHLYADLRAADRQGLDALVVVLPPPSGLGLAIRDRLTKAAGGGAPRSSSRAR